MDKVGQYYSGHYTDGVIDGIGMLATAAKLDFVMDKGVIEVSKPKGKGVLKLTIVGMPIPKDDTKKKVDKALDKTDDELRAMSHEEWGDWYGHKIAKHGVPSRRWRSKKVCTYCGRLGLHSMTCRNPWSVEE